MGDNKDRTKRKDVFQRKKGQKQKKNKEKTERNKTKDRREERIEQRTMKCHLNKIKTKGKAKMKNKW